MSLNAAIAKVTPKPKAVKQSKINTFVGLGSPGLDSDEEVSLQFKRAELTRKFIVEQECDMSRVLDVAGPSTVADYLTQSSFPSSEMLLFHQFETCYKTILFHQFETCYKTKDSVYRKRGYDWTVGNIDGSYYFSSRKEWTVILMLEVLEHILNPLQFFENIKTDGYGNFDMIVSWPNRPSFLKTKNHFHEMGIEEFKYLCDLAGYEVIRIKAFPQAWSWKNWFRGIRPLLRSLPLLDRWTNRHYIAHIRPRK